MNLREKCIKKNYVFKGRIITVRSDEVEIDGKKALREVVEHSGGAGVIAVNKDGKIILVKQYRYATGEELFEIPAGKLDLNEDPLKAAERELAEETGYIGEDFKLIYKVYPSPGYTAEIIYIYSCVAKSRGELNLDEGEFVEVYEFSKQECKALLKENKIIDAKTVIALQHIFAE